MQKFCKFHFYHTREIILEKYCRKRALQVLYMFLWFIDTDAGHYPASGRDRKTTLRNAYSSQVIATNDLGESDH